jgi:hypothetical protein
VTRQAKVDLAQKVQEGAYFIDVTVEMTAIFLQDLLVKLTVSETYRRFSFAVTLSE